MQRIDGLRVALLLLGFTIVGCEPPKEASKAAPPAKQKDEDDHDDHDHGPGPHGGTIIEFGKQHGEFCVDHGKKEVTVYILSGNLKRSVPLAVDKLSLSIKKPAFTVDLVAKPMEGEEKGKSSRFVAVHDNFGVEQEFEGTVSGVVDGKPYSGDFKEKPHEHDAKDKKK